MQFTQKSSKQLGTQIDKLKKVLQDCEAVVIGAGSGLSDAAGLTYSGERFFRYFSDFYAKYGISDMYSGGFYPFKSLEEYWAWWSRQIFYNRYITPPEPIYNKLFEIVKNKNYFVITTNVDHCFQKAGFDKKRLFYTQGDYGLFQCSKPCCSITYDNEAIIRRMVFEQKNMRIPTELIPNCPKCGKPMIVNLRCDNKFVEDDGWDKACNNYKNFLKVNENKKTLFLEIGVGMNTPGIIKYPFMEMTCKNKNSIYAYINLDRFDCPKEIQTRTIHIFSNIKNAIELLSTDL